MDPCLGLSICGPGVGVGEKSRISAKKFRPRQSNRTKPMAIRGLAVREAARAEGCTAPPMYWWLHKARKLL